MGGKERLKRRSIETFMWEASSMWGNCDVSNSDDDENLLGLQSMSVQRMTYSHAPLSDVPTCVKTYFLKEFKKAILTSVLQIWPGLTWHGSLVLGSSYFLLLNPLDHKCCSAQLLSSITGWGKIPVSLSTNRYVNQHCIHPWLLQTQVL